MFAMTWAACSLPNWTSMIAALRTPVMESVVSAGVVNCCSCGSAVALVRGDPAADQGRRLVRLLPDQVLDLTMTLLPCLVRRIGDFGKFQHVCGGDVDLS